jgi:hypothetical protein
MLKNAAAAGQVSDELLLNDTLRLLSKWRSQLIANTLIGRNGMTVQGGPFAGMAYVASQAEGSLAARLIGCYEGELHPHIQAFVEDGIKTVVDIGCAEGYYAVGFARMIPDVVVHAYDTDPRARLICAELAAKNGVADRVKIGEEFQGEQFADFDDGTLVIVDIEGGEVDLLDPGRFDGLRGLNLIVETHPGLRPGATDLLIDRFSPSHTVTKVEHALTAATLPEWLRNGSHFDMILAAWEWRFTPTPWLVMRPRR